MVLLTDTYGKMSFGGGSTPTGTKEITDTSLTDVTEYANAQVVDADLVAGNIKKDVNILGVEGTFEGGGSTPTTGFVPTAWDANGNVTSGIWYGDTVWDHAFALYDTSYKHNCSYYLSDLTASDVVEIEVSAFRRCMNLTSIYWSDKLSIIGDYVFNQCQSLAVSSFPAGLTHIGKQAFYGCIGLTRIEFNSKPSRIDSSAFRSCPNILDIYVPWAEGEVSGAPWEASNATVHYNWTPTE